MEKRGRMRTPESSKEEEEERRRRRRPRLEDDRRVTEEEVEEFFAILRRMHDAARRFPLGKHEGRVREERGHGLWSWTPTFQLKDFQEETRALKGEEKKALMVMEGEEDQERWRAGGIHGCLDLNAEPAPEGNMVLRVHRDHPFSSSIAS